MYDLGLKKNERLFSAVALLFRLLPAAGEEFLV
jgi:hypothetical protein